MQRQSCHRCAKSVLCFHGTSKYSMGSAHQSAAISKVWPNLKRRKVAIKVAPTALLPEVGPSLQAGRKKIGTPVAAKVGASTESGGTMDHQSSGRGPPQVGMDLESAECREKSAMKGPSVSPKSPSLPKSRHNVDSTCEHGPSQSAAPATVGNSRAKVHISVSAGKVYSTFCICIIES